MKKSTLFISFDGLSDPLGQSQILPYLCGIAAKGYQITILSCEKENRISSEEKSIRDKISATGIEWQYILYDENGGFLARMRYVYELYKMALAVIKTKAIQVIHCRSYLTALVGLRLKQQKNIPFIFDMRGFWADERIDGGIWRLSNPIHRLLFSFFKSREKQFLAKANAVVSLTHAGLKELDKNFPDYHLPGKTTIIPCCTNTNLFAPGQTAPKNTLNIGDNDHILIYTGSIGTWYYTKEMIDCVVAWQKFIPNIKLLILTKDQKALEEILKGFSPKEAALVISASASYNEVSSYLSLAKAAIFFIKPAYSKIASSPTKMAECWAADLPIITNSGIGDNDLYFHTHKGGVLINNFNTDDYEKAAKSYLALQAKSGHYRQIALDDFDHRKAIDSYTQIYHRLSNAV